MIDIEQRSEEWHKWRQGKIGGSMAATIMSLNPYCSPLQLYNEIKGLVPKKATTAAMQKGIDLEDIALEMFNNKMHTSMKPMCFEYEKNPRLIASIDGFGKRNGKDAIVEIKVSKKIFEDARNDIIHPMYNCQMQHQMMICNLDSSFFCAYHESEIEILFIKRDQKFIDDLYQKEIEFLEYLDKDIPPPCGEDDYVQVEADFGQLLEIEHYISLTEKINDLEKLQKKARESIIEMGDDGNLEFTKDGKPILRMTRMKREGAVDWDKVVAHCKISPEVLKMFRKEQIGYWRLSKR